MKKLSTVVATFAAFGFVNAASAADMPTKAPMAAPVMAPAYNWTGFYVGGDVGYGWAPAKAPQRRPMQTFQSGSYSLQTI